MFNKVLIPLDSNDKRNARVIELIKKENENNDVDIHGVYVQHSDIDEKNISSDHPTRMMEKMLASHNGKVTTEIRTGDIVDQISKCAKETEVDAIIMVTENNKSRIKSAISGSITQELISKSSCPVVVL